MKVLFVNFIAKSEFVPRLTEARIDAFFVNYFPLV
jgi:hypothetical protein